jgi:predicted nucleic acid-binding protein
MPSGMRVAGYYELPIHIAIAHDVLGSDCSTQIGVIPARILAPGPGPGPGPREIDYPALPPALPGIPVGQLGTHWEWAITYAGEYTLDGATCLRRVGIILSEPEEVLPELPRDFGLLNTRIALAALEDLDAWFDRVRAWIEVLTEQDLDYRSPSYDLTFRGDGFHRWDGRWLTKELSATRTRAINPISVGEWMRVLRNAGEEREPPLEYLVARDARAALLRGELRRAAIDIGTAAEITLHNAYRENIAAIEDAGRALDQAERNLGSLPAALREAGVPLGAAPEDIRDLANARNIAVHEGRELTADQLRPCLTTLTALLKEHGTSLR